MIHLSNEQIIQASCQKKTSDELIQFVDYVNNLTTKKQTKVKLTDLEIKEMFNIYNNYWQASDYGYWCASCRQTVYKNLVKTIIIVNKEIKLKQNGI